MKNTGGIMKLSKTVSRILSLTALVVALIAVMTTPNTVTKRVPNSSRGMIERSNAGAVQKKVTF